MLIAPLYIVANKILSRFCPTTKAEYLFQELAEAGSFLGSLLTSIFDDVYSLRSLTALSCLPSFKFYSSKIARPQAGELIKQPYFELE